MRKNTDGPHEVEHETKRSDNEKEDAMLYEIRSNLERKLSVLDGVSNKLEDDEEYSSQLDEAQCTNPFTYSSNLTQAASENDVLQSFCLDKGHYAPPKMLATLFKRWCKASKDSTSWIKAPNLFSMLKFTMRRPLIAEGKLHSIMESLGLGSELSTLDDLIVGDVQSAQRYRTILRGISPKTIWHISSLRSQYPQGLGVYYEGLKSETGPIDQSCSEADMIAGLAAYITMHESGWLDTNQAVSLISRFLGDSRGHESIKSNLHSDQCEDPLLMAHSLWKRFSAGKRVYNDDIATHLDIDEEFLEYCDDVFNPQNTLQSSIEMIKRGCEAAEFSPSEKSYLLKTYKVPPDIFYNGNTSDGLPVSETHIEQEIDKKQPRCNIEGISDYSHKSHVNGLKLSLGLKGDAVELKSSSGESEAGRDVPRFDAPHAESNAEPPPLVLTNSHPSLEESHPDKIRLKPRQICQKDPVTIRYLPSSPKVPLRKPEQQCITKPKRVKIKKPTLETLCISTSSEDMAAIGGLPDSLSHHTYISNSSSPEDGISSDLFGLPLSTKEARALGTKLKLPQDHIRTIHSITPNRLHAQRIQRMKVLVTFPKKKPESLCTAELKAGPGRKPMSSPGLFTKDGERTRTFVDSHIEAQLFTDVKRRFLRELLLEKIDKFALTKLLNTKDVKLKQPASPETSESEVQKLKAHVATIRKDSHNPDKYSRNNTKVNSLLLSDCKKTSSTNSGNRLPFMSSFEHFESPKEALLLLRQAKSKEVHGLKLAAIYNLCYHISFGVRSCKYDPPESKEENELFALTCQLALHSREAKKRSPFEHSFYNLNQPQQPIKAQTYFQSAASFQNGLANTSFRSFFNKNPDNFINSIFSDHVSFGLTSGKSLENVDICSSTHLRNASNRPLLPQGFHSEEYLSKPAKRRTLLVNGSLRQNIRGHLRKLRMMKKHATTKNAEKIALQDRVSFSLFLALRRQLRAIANQRIPKYRYFQSASGASGVANISIALNKLFERYRDDPTLQPDSIGVEGSMRYLGDVGVKLDEVVVLAVLTELSAPTMGELSRHGFVEGWKNYHADTLPKQQTVIASFRRSLSQTPDFFKRVYKNTFLMARNTGQKSLALDVAIEYWRLLLQAPSNTWNTGSTPWLDWWIEYLETVWKKGISKDMWDQTGVFIQKSQEDESMSWWSEDGAWPGVIDEFVGFVKEKRKGGGGDGMDVA